MPASAEILPGSRTDSVAGSCSRMGADWSGAARRTAGGNVVLLMPTHCGSHAAGEPGGPPASRSSRSGGEDLLALLAQLALRSDVPVERHWSDTEFRGTVRTPSRPAAEVVELPDHDRDSGRHKGLDHRRIRVVLPQVKVQECLAAAGHHCGIGSRLEQGIKDAISVCRRVRRRRATKLTPKSSPCARRLPPHRPFGNPRRSTARVPGASRGGRRRDSGRRGIVRCRRARRSARHPRRGVRRPESSRCATLRRGAAAVRSRCW